MHYNPNIVDDSDRVINNKPPMIIKPNNHSKHNNAEFNVIKSTNQACLAWVSMISMTIVTGVLLSPIVTVDRIKALENIIDLYYIAQASIIGMYMGARAWMSRR